MDGPASPQSVVQTPKGSKLTKIALIVLGIIALVVISEAGYYFYTQRAGAPSPITTPTPTLADERPISIPSPEDRSLRYEKAIRFLNEIEPLVSRSSFFLSVNLSRAVYGEVVSSVFEDKTIDVTRTSYHLTLNNDETDLELHVLLTPEQVSSAEVVLKGESGDAPIELKDILKGDRVLVREEFDVLADSKYDIMYFEVTRTIPE